MVITSDRSAFDTALGKQNVRIFVLLGAKDSDAGKIHDLLESRTDEMPNRSWFLITDAATLKTDERHVWFSDNQDRFRVLIIGAQMALGRGGLTSALMRRDGRPSIFRIRGAFSAAAEP